MASIKSIITTEVFNRVNTILDENKSSTSECSKCPAHTNWFIVDVDVDGYKQFYGSNWMEGYVEVRRWCPEHSYWAQKLIIIISEQDIVLYEYFKVIKDSDSNYAESVTYELADPQSIQKVFDKIKQALPSNGCDQSI